MNQAHLASVEMMEQRRMIIARIIQEKNFTLQRQVADEIINNLTLYPAFAGLTSSSICVSVNKYADINKRKKTVSKRKSRVSKLPLEVKIARRNAVEAAIAQGFRRAYAIAKHLQENGENSFAMCKHVQNIERYIKKNFPELLLTKTNQSVLRPQEKLPKYDIPFDLEKMMQMGNTMKMYIDDFYTKLADLVPQYAKSKELNDLLKRQNQGLHQEIEAHKCPDVVLIHALLGEKEVELQNVKTKCSELEHSLICAKEEIKKLKDEVRDPDEDLKYELKEKEEEIAQLHEDIKVKQEQIVLLKKQLDEKVKHVILNEEKHFALPSAFKDTSWKG